MKRTRITLCIAVLSVVILSACDQNELVPQTVDNEFSTEIEASTEIDGAQIINGRLAFDSKLTFENVVLTLGGMSDADLMRWQNENLPGFTSVYERFENLTDDDINKIASQETVNGYQHIAYLRPDGEDMELVRTIDHDALAVLTNENGVLQIADRVYYMGYESTLEVISPSEQDIKTLTQTNWDGSVNIDIFDHPTKRTFSSTTSREETTVTCDRYYYKKNRRRWKHEAVVNEGWLTSGINSTVKHQAKILGVWGNSSGNSLVLHVIGTFWQGDPINPSGPGHTEFVNDRQGPFLSTKKLKWSFYTCVLTSCEFSADGTSFFEGNGVDNSYRNCTLTFPEP